jgi:hypothetical protein
MHATRKIRPGINAHERSQRRICLPEAVCAPAVDETSVEQATRVSTAGSQHLVTGLQCARFDADPEGLAWRLSCDELTLLVDCTFRVVLADLVTPGACFIQIQAPFLRCTCGLAAAKQRDFIAWVQAELSFTQVEHDGGILFLLEMKIEVQQHMSGRTGYDRERIWRESLEGALGESFLVPRVRTGVAIHDIQRVLTLGQINRVGLRTVCLSLDSRYNFIVLSEDLDGPNESVVPRQRLH